MTQPAEAVGGEAAPVTETNPADYFTQLAEEEFGVGDEQEQPAEGADEQSEATEEADDDTQVEEEADDLPPIDAPVSWDAEAKAKFAELPRDVQEYVAKREGERERFVQQKSQEATRARQDAEQAAIQQLAQIENGYAQHFQQLAEQIAPQRPNPALLQHDPMAFYAQQAAYEESVAQQRQLQQRSHEFAQQAQAREAQAEQAFNAEQRRIIVENFPEYADPTSGPKLRAELSSVAKDMGYTDELIAQARATDILAMRKAAEWKAKADRYDALQKTKMAKVREAKGKPPVTTRPGVAQGGPQLSARNAQSALEVARTSKNRDVQGAAFFDYLKSTGQIS
jgi:hypothetical protein